VRAELARQLFFVLAVRDGDRAKSHLRFRRRGFGAFPAFIFGMTAPSAIAKVAAKPA
jgi:hypothetical protein